MADACPHSPWVVGLFLRHSVRKNGTTPWRTTVLLLPAPQCMGRMHTSWKGLTAYTYMLVRPILTMYPYNMNLSTCASVLVCVCGGGGGGVVPQ